MVWSVSSWDYIKVTRIITLPATSHLPQLGLYEVAHVVSVRVEGGVGGPGDGVHRLEAGGETLLGSTGEGGLT